MSNFLLKRQNVVVFCLSSGNRYENNTLHYRYFSAHVNRDLLQLQEEAPIAVIFAHGLLKQR